VLTLWQALCRDCYEGFLERVMLTSGKISETSLQSKVHHLQHDIFFWPHESTLTLKPSCQATAFCMSQNSRLGAKSMVPSIQNEVLSLVFEYADPWHGKSCIKRPLGGILFFIHVSCLCKNNLYSIFEDLHAGLSHYSESLRTKAVEQEFKAQQISPEKSWAMCECKTVLCPAHVHKGVLKSSFEAIPAPCGWCDGTCAECGGCAHEDPEHCEVCGGGSEMPPCLENDCPGCHFDMDSEEDLEDCNELAFGATVIIHPQNSYLPASMGGALFHSAGASLGKVVGYDFECSSWAVIRINIWGEQTEICYKRRDRLTLAMEGMREVSKDKATRDAHTLLMAASEPDEERLRNFYAAYDQVLLRLIEQNRSTGQGS